MKYYIFFHMINGRDIRATLEAPEGADLEANSSAISNELTSKPFWHFYEENRLVVVNMRNVAYVKIAKAE